MFWEAVRQYRGYILFSCVLVLCLGLLAGFVWRGTHAVRAAAQAVDRSEAVIAKNQDLAAQFDRMLASQQAYVLSGDERFTAAYDAGRTQVVALVADLSALVQADAAQASRVNELQFHYLTFAERLDDLALAYRAERAQKITEEEAEKPREAPKTVNGVHLGDLVNFPQPLPRPMPTMAVVEGARESLARISKEIVLSEQARLQESAAALETAQKIYRLKIIGGCAACLVVFLFGITLLARAAARNGRDESGLTEKEKVLQLAIEGSNDGIFEWNLDKDTAFYSRQFWSMLGYDFDRFPSTMDSFKKLLHPDDSERVTTHIEKYLSGELPDYLIIFRLRHKTGRWVWINARGRALYDDKGRPYRIVGAHTDISHIKAYEEKLQKAKETAEKASRAKTDFLAHMSHEIRTPLTAISGIAEIFGSNQGNLDDKQKQLVRTLNSSTSSLKELINDILDFSKIESGELELEEKSFVLHNLFEQVISIVSVKAHEKGISFNVDYDDVRKIVFLGDRARLRQILINLAGNAVKFTDKGSVSITASRMQKDGVPQLKIDVADTGIGIDPKNFDLIFERFKQGDSSVSRKYGGTGLGLPISRRLAGLMGGEISVQSTPGQGSVFSLVLPLKIEEELEDVPTDDDMNRALSDSIRAQKLGRKNILLVEDYEGNIVLLSYLLEELQCSYDVARTGLEAVNMWKEKHYDLVLMDVQMPEMDGFTATGQIRRMERENGMARTPIIGMTAHALVGDKEKCIEAGMDSYLPKPIVELDLKAKIVEYISHADIAEI